MSRHDVRTNPGGIPAQQHIAAQWPTEEFEPVEPQPNPPDRAAKLFELGTFACLATACVAFWSNWPTELWAQIVGASGLGSFLLDATLLARVSRADRNALRAEENHHV